MFQALLGNSAAVFASGSHNWVSGPQANQFFFKVNGTPLATQGTLAVGIREGSTSPFTVISPSHFKINNIPVASVQRASAPPGLSNAITSGGNFFFNI